MKRTSVAIMVILLLSLFPYTMDGISAGLDDIVDMDNDGTVDDFDLVPDGNAVLVISVDSFETNGTWHPNFVLGLDRSGNGLIEVDELRDDLMMENVSTVNMSGYGALVSLGFRF